MNAHVFVLVLLSAAFMAVWDGDQNHNNQVLLSRARARAEAVSTIAATRPAAPRKAYSRVPANQAKHRLPTQRENVSSTIPLPTNLTPGTWRVISDRGDSLLITVENTRSADERQISGEATATCITSVVDNQRWCFFKQTTLSTQQAHRRDAVVESAVRN